MGKPPVYEQLSFPDREYTLEDLSAETGINPRTIRGYIAQDLLPGADGRGPKSAYSRRHLLRLLAIRNLKDSAGMSLSEISTTLLQLSDKQIEQIATESGPIVVARTGGAPTSSVMRASSQAPPMSGLVAGNESGEEPPTATAKGTALEYLESLGIEGSARMHRRYPPTAARADPDAPLNRLLAKFERMHGRRVARKARGENRYRIPITPEIELSVRANVDPRFLRTLERIADHLRHELSGEWKEDD